MNEIGTHSAMVSNANQEPPPMNVAPNEATINCETRNSW